MLVQILRLLTKPSSKTLRRCLDLNLCSFCQLMTRQNVPFGITVATRPAPLVMHLECEVRLPDHDFVVTSKHKLVPSVYTACEIQTTSASCQPEIS